jgi:hypothetical protein
MKNVEKCLLITQILPKSGSSAKLVLNISKRALFWEEMLSALILIQDL